MNYATFSSEINLNDFSEIFRDLSEGKLTYKSHPEYGQKEFLVSAKKCTSFGIAFKIVNYNPDENNNLIFAHYTFSNGTAIFEFTFNRQSPSLIQNRFDVLRKFSQFVPPPKLQFIGIQWVSINSDVESFEYSKLLSELKCKYLKINNDNVIVKHLEDMNRVETLQVSEFETLLDVIGYPRKLPIDSIEITMFIEGNVIPLFEKIDSFPNGNLLIQNYQRHLQQPDRFTQWLYPAKDFDTLILAGLSGKNDNIWTKFLCCDTPEMGLYDPRMLVLIWRFAEDKD